MLSKSDWLGIALTAIGVAAGFLMGGTLAGILCLAIGFVALVVWHRTNDHGLTDPDAVLGFGDITLHQEAKARTDGRQHLAVNPRWGQLAARLTELRQESSNAHLLFVSGQRPIAEHIRSAFELAKWDTSMVPSAFDEFPQGGVGHYYSGIEVRGHNLVLIEAAAEALRTAELSGVFTTVEPLNLPRENPKWGRLQQRVTILVGYQQTGS